eukprot:366229-Chlamydomonas_euryale.AAC.32
MAALTSAMSKDGPAQHNVRACWVCPKPQAHDFPNVPFRQRKVVGQTQSVTSDSHGVHGAMPTTVVDIHEIRANQLSVQLPTWACHFRAQTSRIAQGERASSVRAGYVDMFGTSAQSRREAGVTMPSHVCDSTCNTGQAARSR